MTEETGQRIATALERIAAGIEAVTYDTAPSCEQGIGVVQLGPGVTLEALRLITTWTTPGLATPETVSYAHEKARQVLGLEMEGGT